MKSRRSTIEIFAEVLGKPKPFPKKMILNCGKYFKDYIALAPGTLCTDMREIVCAFFNKENEFKLALPETKDVWTLYKLNGDAKIIFAACLVIFEVPEHNCNLAYIYLM